MVSASQLLSSLPEQDFLGMLDSNPSCKGMLLGYIAEQVLIKHLEQTQRFLSVTKIPDVDKTKGDILVKYEGADGGERSATIEVKCMGSRGVRENLLEGGYNGSVCIKASDSRLVGDQMTSSQERGLFDILAICTITATGNWDFVFIHNKYLPSSENFANRLRSTMLINTENTPCLHKDIFRVLQDMS